MDDVGTSPQLEGFQPFSVKYRLGNLALAHNGNLSNVRATEREQTLASTLSPPCPLTCFFAATLCVPLPLYMCLSSDTHCAPFFARAWLLLVLVLTLLPGSSRSSAASSSSTACSCRPPSTLSSSSTSSRTPSVAPSSTRSSMLCLRYLPLTPYASASYQPTHSLYRVQDWSSAFPMPFPVLTRALPVPG